MATKRQEGVKGVGSVTRAEAQDLFQFIRELVFREATGGRLVFAHYSVLHPDKWGSWQENNEGWHGRKRVEWKKGSQSHERETETVKEG